MSFMYESMKSRGPGKRKIKLQEKNLLSILQEDEDDDEDDDFDVSKQTRNQSDGSTVSSDDSSYSSSEDASTSSFSSEAEEAQKISGGPSNVNQKQHIRDKGRSYVSPTIETTNTVIRMQRQDLSTSEILSKAKRQFDVTSRRVVEQANVGNPKICSVCLKKDNSCNIIACNLCGILVHKECYGETLHSMQSARSTPYWFCSSCASGRSQKSCEFCPVQDGCFKETSLGQWCHVVCARYILGKDMYRTGSNRLVIDQSGLNYKRYGLRECLLCEDKLVAKTGICVKCDAGFCKSFFHATCAQKYGLLSENESGDNCDPYFVYCPLHIGKENMAKSQKLYITAQAALTKRKDQMNDTWQESLLKSRRSYANWQHVRYPIQPTAGTPCARLLSSNAAALQALNKKAEKELNIDVRSPASYFPKPSDVRKRHHVAPALTCEFASHYADRELRIVEMRERIENMTNENEAMIAEQEDLRKKYEELQARLDSLQKHEEDVTRRSQSLFHMFLRLKMWSDENKSTFKSNSNLTRLQPVVNSANILDKAPPFAARTQSDDAIETQPKPTMSTGGSASANFFKRRCSVCKSNKLQHLLINCDQCCQWFHLACLDPPLASMPRKSKYSLWQCSKCAPSSGNESGSDDATRGLTTTSEGRRHTRRTHKPPDKFASSSRFEQHRDNERLISNGRIINNRSKIRKKPKRNIVVKLRKNLEVAKEKHSKPQAVLNESISKPTVVVRRDSVPDRVLNAVEQQQPNAKRVSEKPSLLPTSSSNSSTKQKVVIKPIKFRCAHPVPGSTACVKPIEKSKGFMPKYILFRKATGKHSKFNIAIKRPQTSSDGSIKKIENSLQSKSSQILEIEKVEKRHAALGSVTSTSASRNLKGVSVEKEMPSKKTKRDNTPHLEADNSNQFKTVSPLFCFACRGKNDENKMMHCHTCKHYYHIWCCDPPLATRPKPSKFFKWECSDCHCSSEEPDIIDLAGSKTTPDGRRKITRARKPPEKFANIFYSSSQQRLMKAVLGRRKNPLERKRNLQQFTRSKRSLSPQNINSTETEAKTSSSSSLEVFTESSHFSAITEKTASTSLTTSQEVSNLTPLKERSRSISKEASVSVVPNMVLPASLPEYTRSTTSLQTVEVDLNAPQNIKVNYTLSSNSCNASAAATNCTEILENIPVEAKPVLSCVDALSTLSNSHEPRQEDQFAMLGSISSLHECDHAVLRPNLLLKEDCNVEQSRTSVARIITTEKSGSVLGDPVVHSKKPMEIRIDSTEKSDFTLKLSSNGIKNSDPEVATSINIIKKPGLASGASINDIENARLVSGSPISIKHPDSAKETLSKSVEKPPISSMVLSDDSHIAKLTLDSETPIAGVKDTNAVLVAPFNTQKLGLAVRTSIDDFETLVPVSSAYSDVEKPGPTSKVVTNNIVNPGSPNAAAINDAGSPDLVLAASNNDRSGNNFASDYNKDEDLKSDNRLLQVAELKVKKSPSRISNLLVASSQTMPNVELVSLLTPPLHRENTQDQNT